MATTNLGRVSIVPKGAYNASTEYKRQDLVTHDNNTYLAIADSTGVAVTDTTKWLKLIDTSNVEDMTSYIADTYSASATYKIGDLVIHEGNLYECWTNIDTPEQWTSAHWKVTNFGNEIADVLNDARIYQYLTNNGKYTVTAADMESGSWNYSNKSSNAKRLRNKNLIPVRAGMQIAYSNPTLKVVFSVLPNKASGSYSQLGSWNAPGGSGIVNIAKDGYLVYLCESANDSNITVNNYDCSVTITSVFANNLKYNAYDIFDGLLEYNKGTYNGVNFALDDGKYIISRTSSSSDPAVCILITSQDLPKEVVPGNDYYVRYTKSTATSDVRLRIIWKDAGGNTLSTSYAARDRIITPPTGATAWAVGLIVDADEALPNPVEITEIKLLNALSNAELTEMTTEIVAEYPHSRGSLPDGTDLNDVTDIGIYTIVNGFTYLNAPYSTPSATPTILEVIPGTDNTKIQRLTRQNNIECVVFTRRSTLGSFANSEWKSEGNRLIKKYVAFGDSLTVGAVWNAVNDGTDSHRVLNYMKIPHRIAVALNMEGAYENMGVGGIGYVTKIADKNIVDMVKEYDFTDVELVTFMAGPNDTYVSLGFYDSEAGDGTICGAIREIIDYMRENYPKVQLIFIQATPNCPPSIGTPWSGRMYWSLDDFDEQVSKLCYNQHVGYVSWYNCSYVDTWNIRNVGYRLGDGPNYAHPIADEDYPILGDYLAARISAFGYNDKPAVKYDIMSYGYGDMQHNAYLKLSLEARTLDPYIRSTNDAGYSWLMVPVKAGDIVRLKTTAGTLNAFPYAIVEQNYLITYTYVDSSYFNGSITIEHDGFLAVNMKNTYKDKFICKVQWDITKSSRDELQLQANKNQIRRQNMTDYDPDNVCKTLITGPSLMGFIHHWAIIGASYDSGEFNWTKYSPESHPAEIEWYEYSCWAHLQRINGIPDLYNYSDGGQNAKEWIYLGPNTVRGYAYTTDTEVVNPYGSGRHGIGPGGGCWWKMLQDYRNGDVKQAFVINLGSNDINNNYPHDEDWNTLENYDAERYYTCGTIADIGTYDLATDTDTVPSGKQAGIVPGVVNSYAAYIGAILNRILAIQPDAIIFLCTIRNGFSTLDNRFAIWTEYNNTLKQIAAMDQYKNNVYILDNGRFGPNYYVNPIRSTIVYAHPNALGYVILANYWNTLIDHAIQTNYTKFKQSMFIGTGKSYIPPTS